MKTGDMVIVATEDGAKPGVVKYVCRDGMIGVNLMCEGRRVDEWNPSQVRVVSGTEAAVAAVKFLPKRFFERN